MDEFLKDFNYILRYYSMTEYFRPYQSDNFSRGYTHYDFVGYNVSYDMVYCADFYAPMSALRVVRDSAIRELMDNQLC